MDRFPHKPGMIRRRAFLGGLTAAAAVPHAAGAAPARGPLVLAAVSLQGAMQAAADRWAGRGHARPLCSFAATSALARQVLAGAAADLFVSADEAWMDAVARAGRIVPGSRVAFLGNRLVAIQAASAARVPATIPLRRAFAHGRIALADPDAVPAGRYARAALARLGMWEMVAPRVVRAENVRAALALVERGAAEWGMVYATDARASARVRAFRMMPERAHPPIRYPLARLRSGSHAEAEAFRRFLIGGEGRAIFARAGFVAL